MKKTFRTLVSVLLLVCMLASMQVFTVSAAEDVSVYTGATVSLSAAVNDVIEIDSADEFVAFQKDSVSKNYDGITIKLTTDIRLNEGDYTAWSDTVAPTKGMGQWTPIGKQSSDMKRKQSFNGTFDGQGHTIYGLYFAHDFEEGDNNDNGETGLFGRINGSAVIKNFTLAESYIGAVNATKGSTRIGIIGAAIGATAEISNVHAYQCTFEGGNIGGIIGRTNGTSAEISDCSVSECAITTFDYGNVFTGGILGYAQATTNIIKNCRVSDTVIEAPDFGGGILGVYYSNPATITNCVVDNCDIIATTGSANVGGVVGAAYKDSEGGTVKNCVVYETYVDGTYKAGGIIGAIDSEKKATFKVESCLFAYGVVSNLNNSNGIGGIVACHGKSGAVGSNLTIKDSAFVGTLECLNEQANSRVGGILGGAVFAKAEIDNCVAVGDFVFSAEEVSNAGYICGTSRMGEGNGQGPSSVTLRNCVADIVVSSETVSELPMCADGGKGTIDETDCVEAEVAIEKDIKVGDLDFRSVAAITLDGECVLAKNAKDYKLEASKDFTARLKGYQTTDLSAGGSFDVRLVGLIDTTDVTKYWGVGYDIVIINEGGEVIAANEQNVHSAYKSILGGNKTYEAADEIGADDESAFFLLNIRGLSLGQGELTFVVKTYTINNQRIKTYTDMSCFTIDTGDAG